MVDAVSSPAGFLSLLGIAFGLALLGRGMVGQRRAARIGDTSTSTISAIAVGEVRVSGIVEAAELTLRSPLQSKACVYYHAQVEAEEGRTSRRLLDDERAIGFRVRDPSGDVRVFPGGASWLVPDTFDAWDGWTGDQPAGLDLRSGEAIQPGALDRERQIAELLTVRRHDGPGLESLDALDGGGLPGGRGRRHYREARLELGDIVTIVGMAMPFDQLPDPTGADAGGASGLDASGAVRDAEVARDLADARAAGLLETDPAAAWGNAAIPGFGVGRPVREPELDAGATAPPIATAADAARAERTFEIAPTTIILTAAPEVPLLISLGPPVAAVAREERRFVLGLLGAVLAIGSAVILAVTLSGGPPS
jgi:hypothetical protein